MARISTFRISEPPKSLNTTKAPGARRWRSSAKHKAWQNLAHSEVAGQPSNIPAKCYWRADILIPADKTAADLDNLPKSIFDVLVKAGKVPDDRYLVDYRVRFWAGDHVKATIKQENTDLWAQIKKPSKSLFRKLAKSSHSEQDLL